MKALKMMLSGIMLMLTGIFCIVGGAGILGYALMLAAIVLFIWGLMTK